jgi:UDP-glucose 4-epimerase
MANTQKKRIVVTGGAGFIASHITDAYIAAGHKVAVIDDLSTGFRKNVNPKAHFYKADIRDMKKLEAIFKKEKPQIVNHHAAVAEPVRSMREPERTYTSNVLGIINLLSLMGHYKSERIIFASTGGAIYGEPRHIPADESNPITPLSPYGFSKYLGEECIKQYSRWFGYDYVIFRYPNVYGPRQNPKGEAGVVAIFGGLMKAGRVPTIYGDGTKTREYVYVKDIARANELALVRGTGEIMNIGIGRAVSDNEIFKEVAEALNFKQPVKYAPYRNGEVYKIALDGSKGQKILGWKPTVALKDGIRLALETVRPNKA